MTEAESGHGQSSECSSHKSNVQETIEELGGATEAKQSNAASQGEPCPTDRLLRQAWQGVGQEGPRNSAGSPPQLKRGNSTAISSADGDSGQISRTDREPQVRNSATAALFTP